jgi:hypothetical protein
MVTMIFMEVIISRSIEMKTIGRMRNHWPKLLIRPRILYYIRSLYMILKSLQILTIYNNTLFRYLLYTNLSINTLKSLKLS